MEEQGTAALRAMQLRSPSGNTVPLGEIVTMREQQGFAAIQRQDGKTTISVSGEIDAALNTTDGVVERLTQSGALDSVARTYGVTYKFGGRSQEQGEAFKDLQIGTALALMVVYIILAWVFGSYFKPLAVMLIIPFGIVGAVFGHWILDFQLTVLSLIGLLGLAVFLNFFGLPRSAPLVGGLVLTLMTLPTIIIASRASLKPIILRRRRPSSVTGRPVSRISASCSIISRIRARNHGS